VKIFIENKNKSLDIKFNGKASSLLKKLKINPEEVIIIKNNALVSLDENLNESDNVKILSVVSGG
jgi:sulfur carrier protein ThiS